MKHSWPLVSIIILTYNKPWSQIIKTIKSVTSMNYEKFEVIIVDNNDTNYLEKEVATVTDRPIKYISGQGNVGPSAGRNLGIRNSEGKFLLFLDDDVIVEQNALPELVKIAEKESSIGIIGLSNVPWDTNSYYKPYLDQNPNKNVIDVPFVFGCAMMTRREVFEKVGLFDEIYFFGHEDRDFTYRVQKNGFRLTFARTAKFHHSGLKDGVKKLFIPKRAYYWHRNLFVFAGRNFNDIREDLKFLFAQLVFANRKNIPVFYIIYAIQKGKILSLLSYSLGIKDGIALYLKLLILRNRLIE